MATNSARTKGGRGFGVSEGPGTNPFLHTPTVAPGLRTTPYRLPYSGGVLRPVSPCPLPQRGRGPSVSGSLCVSGHSTSGSPTFCALVRVFHVSGRTLRLRRWGRPGVTTSGRGSYYGGPWEVGRGVPGRSPVGRPRVTLLVCLTRSESTVGPPPPTPLFCSGDVSSVPVSFGLPVQDPTGPGTRTFAHTSFGRFVRATYTSPPRRSSPLTLLSVT